MDATNSIMSGLKSVTVLAKSDIQNSSPLAGSIVHQEIAEQLGEAFDNLALAATTKNDTIDKLANSIAKLTATNTSLTKRIEELEELNKALKQQLYNKCNNSKDGGEKG